MVRVYLQDLNRIKFAERKALQFCQNRRLK